MSFRNGYKPPRDPHGYFRASWVIAITFFILGTLATGFLTGCIWYATTHP